MSKESISKKEKIRRLKEGIRRKRRRRRRRLLNESVQLYRLLVVE
jgi:hypothetical protein